MIFVNELFSSLKCIKPKHINIDTEWMLYWCIKQKAQKFNRPTKWKPCFSWLLGDFYHDRGFV